MQLWRLWPSSMTVGAGEVNCRYLVCLLAGREGGVGIDAEIADCLLLSYGGVCLEIVGAESPDAWPGVFVWHCVLLINTGLERG
jgi:hypothetical protein